MNPKLRQYDKEVRPSSNTCQHHLHLTSAGTPAPNRERHVADKGVAVAAPGHVRAFAQRSAKSLLSLGTRYYDEPLGIILQVWKSLGKFWKVLSEIPGLQNAQICFREPWE